MDSSLYVQIAKNAIRSHFTERLIDKDEWLERCPELSAQGATFVTLTIHGHLRGCIGSIIAHRSLIEDLMHNAISAAFHDPRFPPLSRDELEEVDVEVSLLTPPLEVTYKDASELSRIIRPKIDGVILRLGHYQATFLPQVWEELPDFHSFFSHLGLKAGIGSNPLSYHPDIYTYQVEKYKEHSDA